MALILISYRLYGKILERARWRILEREKLGEGINLKFLYPLQDDFREREMERALTSIPCTLYEKILEREGR